MSSVAKISELRAAAAELKIDIRGMSKTSIARAVHLAEGHSPKKDRHRVVGPLGVSGKEGSVFEIRSQRGKVFAKKQFRKSKSAAKIEKEARLQQIAAGAGLSPSVDEFNLVEKYILMEKLESNLYDMLVKKRGKLTQKLQREMLSIFTGLDAIGVFHKDPNPLNFMFDSAGSLKIIDFGFAETISERKHGRTPNLLQMPLGLLLKLREIFPDARYTVLEAALPENARAMFQTPVLVPEV